MEQSTPENVVTRTRFPEKEAAEMFGMSIRTLRRMRADRVIPHHRVGKFIYYTAEDLRQIDEASRVEALNPLPRPYGIA